MTNNDNLLRELLSTNPVLLYTLVIIVAGAYVYMLIYTLNRLNRLRGSFYSHIDRRYIKTLEILAYKSLSGRSEDLEVDPISGQQMIDLIEDINKLRNLYRKTGSKLIITLLSDKITLFEHMVSIHFPYTYELYARSQPENNT